MCYLIYYYTYIFQTRVCFYFKIELIIWSVRKMLKKVYQLYLQNYWIFYINAGTEYQQEWGWHFIINYRYNFKKCSLMFSTNTLIKFLFLWFILFLYYYTKNLKQFKFCGLLQFIINRLYIKTFHIYPLTLIIHMSVKIWWELNTELLKKTSVMKDDHKTKLVPS